MTFTDAPSPYRRNACRTTADTSVPSAAARCFAAFHRSSGTRTARIGVCVSLPISAPADLGGAAGGALAERREHLRVRRAAAHGAVGARRLGDLLLAGDSAGVGGVVGGDSGGAVHVDSLVGVYGHNITDVYGHVKRFPRTDP
jgi:hypothetical protein